jgi:RloB-like protein
MATRGKLDRHQVKTNFERPIRWRRYGYLFLIVCEDEKTEPAYFHSFVELFPPETVFLRTIGAGRSSLGVVEKALEEKHTLWLESKKEVDETWAVFDKDDADQSPGNTSRFLQAFALGRKKQVHIAYSNEIFELWLLLHLEQVDPTQPMPRKEVYDRLEWAVSQNDGYEGFLYRHGETTVLEFLKNIGNEEMAFSGADLLNAYHLKQGNMPLYANPSTSVNRLVKRLRELLAYYGYDPKP